MLPLVVAGPLFTLSVTGSPALELALTRIYSVTMYYHFAFLAISVALLGLAEMGTEPVNHAKFGIKIAITVVVLLISWPRRRDQEIPSGTYHAVGILALTNVAIAVFVK